MSYAADHGHTMRPCGGARLFVIARRRIRRGLCGVPCSTRQLGAGASNVGKYRREIRAFFEFLQFLRQLEPPIGIFAIGTRDVDRIRHPEEIVKLQRQQRRVRTCEVQMERMAKGRPVGFLRRELPVRVLDAFFLRSVIPACRGRDRFARGWPGSSRASSRRESQRRGRRCAGGRRGSGTVRYHSTQRCGSGS